MASCPTDDKLDQLLKSPKIMALKTELKELLSEVPCSINDGQHGGISKETLLKISAATLAIATAVNSIYNTNQAFENQCGISRSIMNIVFRDDYCLQQQQILATSMYRAFASIGAAATAATVAYNSMGGRKRRRTRRRTRRRRSSKKKTHKKKTHKKKTHKKKTHKKRNKRSNRRR